MTRIPEFKEYGIEYSWRDGKYSLTVMATSPEDAMERIRAAGSRGRCYTPHGIAATFKVPTWWGRLHMWLRGQP
jgi:hypothetical protein